MSSTERALFPAPASRECTSGTSFISSKPVRDESRSESGRLAEINSYPLEDDDGLCVALYYYLWKKDSNGKRCVAGRRRRTHSLIARRERWRHRYVCVCAYIICDSSRDDSLMKMFCITRK